MIKQTVLPGYLIYAMLVACTGQQNNPSSQLRGADENLDTPQSSCSSSETPFPMMFAALPDAIKADLGAFSQIAANEHLVAAGADQNMRLDYCMDNQTGVTKLRNILVYHKGDMPEKMAYAVGEDGIGGDVSQLMNDKYTGFNVNQRPTEISPWSTSLVVLGTGEAGKGYAVAALSALDESGKFTAAGGTWIAGRIVPGDPFSTEKCPFGEEFKTESFAIGSAKLDVDRCSQTLNISGEQYTIIRVGVTDSNPKLPKKTRGLREFRGTNLNTVLKYTVTHHNATDAMILSLPEVTYERKIDLPKIIYSVKYGNEDWAHFPVNLP